MKDEITFAFSKYNIYNIYNTHFPMPYLSNIASVSSYDLDIIIKVFIAAIVGLIIGFDRQKINKPAGTRTQMLICVGSALLAGISIHISQIYSFPGATSRPDPARLMAQVITGIGFLGAGVILKENNRISGVTTAATIWITAALGIAIGSGFYIPVVFCIILVLLLHPLARLEYKLGLKTFAYTLQIPRDQWIITIKTLNEIKVKYTISNASESKAQFVVYSSQSKKKRLANYLENEKISFEIIENDE